MRQKDAVIESQVEQPQRPTESELRIELPPPFGSALVSYRGDKLRSVRFARRHAASQREKRNDTSPFARSGALEEKLREDFQAYFSGEGVKFDYPLDLNGFTFFQRAVWAAMRAIPYGETRSYQWIARKIGKPRATRAVGNACGKNPLAIVQPCHRVVGSSGKLGGFSGGLDLKKALLRLEGVVPSKFR